MWKGGVSDSERILVDRFSLADGSHCRDDEFRSHLLSLGKILSPALCLLIDQLYDAASVAQVYEDKASLVSLFCHPSHDGDGLPYVCFTKFGASACAL